MKKLFAFLFQQTYDGIVIKKEYTTTMLVSDPFSEFAASYPINTYQVTVQVGERQAIMEVDVNDYNRVSVGQTIKIKI